MPDDQNTKLKLRGFAALPLEKRLEYARKGGAAVPSERRSFSQDPDLAKIAAGKSHEARRAKRNGGS